MLDEKNLLLPYEKQFDVPTRKRMVAEMLGELRKAKGYQQKEVAEVLGISPQTYNGYEKGRNEPPIEMLVRLSFLYGIPIDILVQKDRMHAYDQSAMETVKALEREIAIMREECANDPLGQNLQIQALITAMEQLAEVNKKMIEKHHL